MQVMIRIGPWQAGQVSMSMPNSRSGRCARVIKVWRSAGPSSTKAVVDYSPPLPRLGRAPLPGVGREYAVEAREVTGGLWTKAANRR